MKKILKLFCIVSIFISLFTFSTVLAVEADVQINGKIIDFTDENGQKVNGQIINDRTMVPLRKIFEVLGCEIEWNGETRTVIAKQAEKEIVLQINNKVAIKRENGEEEKIILDTAPVIVNSRTLVPLRFVAESLEKQVGWDKSSYTAIIIDYDYFSELIKQKNANLYNFLSTQNNNVSFNITRNYYDNSNSYNSNIATLKGLISTDSNTSNITLNFEGDNELIKEIISEGWGNITYEAKYLDNQIFIKSYNDIFSKILNINTNDFSEIEVESLAITGTPTDNLSKAVSSIFNIQESALNVSTFNKMENDFNKFLNLFVANGSRSLSYSNAKIENFDYTKFDNIIYNNEISRTLSFINKSIFNYDVVQDELLYDWSKINYNLNCQNNTLVLNITLENEYNERVSYTINCESN